MFYLNIEDMFGNMRNLFFLNRILQKIYYQCNYQILGNKGKLTANKAFTPKVDQTTTLTWEHDYQTEIIDCAADNHFAKAMIEFYDIINNPDNRAKHYKEILQQSEALETIAELSK